MRSVRLAAVFALTVPMVLVAGCPHDNYSIEMTVQHDQIHRTITYRPASGVIEPDTAAQQLDAAETPPEGFFLIAKAYGADPTMKDGAYHGDALFQNVLPDDVGDGTGRYFRYDSSLGSACFYVETFRGSNDPWKQVQARIQGADTYIDVCRGVLRKRFADHPHLAKLDTFLDTQGREDLKSLAILVWYANSTQIGPGMSWPPLENDDEEDLHLPTPPARQRFPDKAILKAQGMSDFIARCGVFLIERGYLTRDTLSRLIIMQAEASLAWEGLLREFWINKVNLPADSSLPGDIAKLLSQPDLTKSLAENYIRTTPAWKQAAATLLADPDTTDAETIERIASVWERDTGIRAFKDISIDISDSNDVVRVTLKADGPVLSDMTNGRIAEDARTVTWEGRVDDFQPDGHYYNMPMVIYAVWTVPADRRQVQLLGRIALQNTMLIQYATWIQQLDDEQRKQWEDFLAQLTPGTVAAKLNSFPISKKENKIFRDGWQLLCDALGVAPTTQPTP